MAEGGLGVSTGQGLQSTTSPGPCCYLLQEDHLPVQGAEEGTLLHLLGPVGRHGSSGLYPGAGQVAPTNSWFGHFLALRPWASSLNLNLFPHL